MDFEKAFDSIHTGSLWNILRSYGIPSKMARVIAGVYEGFECAVIDGSETSDWFKIESGVKQGCGQQQIREKGSDGISQQCWRI